MKKLSLLFVMMLAFTVSTMAQSTVLIPSDPDNTMFEWIDSTPYQWPDGTWSLNSQFGIYLWNYDIMQNFTANDYPGRMAELEAWDQGITLEYHTLEPEKVSFSIYTDNDKVFVFDPEEFTEFDEPTSVVPYSVFEGPNGNGTSHFAWDCIHFKDRTNHVEGIEGMDPFFTWRIGLQILYTDEGVTTSSNIIYMEVFPQLKPASQVTPTSFLADWSGVENTYQCGNFEAYDLYVVNKDNPDDQIVITDLFAGQDEDDIAGGSYLVENLTPGATYQYYVISRTNTNQANKSVVREVTLPKEVFILGEVNNNTWAANIGLPMEYDAETGVYTATVNLDGRNEGYNYFSFTTELALYNDEGSWNYIAPFRFGAVSEGDFLVTDELLGQELSLTYENGQAFKVPAGTYDLTLNKETMKLIIEKEKPAIQIGDVNKDGQISIADVTELIDHLLSGDFAETDHFSPYAANVNEDTEISIADVTDLIDILLSM